MSKLLKRQQQFASMLPKLFQFILDQGYSFTLGDAFRDARCNYGSKRSLHKIRLAIDINLFQGDKYLKDTSDHQKVGEFWESLGGSWGGRFNDGNHYSLSFNGMR